MSEDPKKLKGFRIKDMKIGDTGIGEKPSESEGFELTKGDEIVLSKLKEIDPDVESYHATISVFSDERFKFGYDETKEQISKRIEKFERMDLIMKLKPGFYYYKNRFIGYHNRTDSNLDYYSFKDGVQEIDPAKPLSVFDNGKVGISKLEVVVPDLKDVLRNSIYPIDNIIMNLFMCEGFYLDNKAYLLFFLKKHKDEYGLCVADRDIGNLQKGDLCSKSHYDYLIAETSGADAGSQKKGVGGFLEAQSGEDGVKPIVEVETTTPTSPAVNTELADPFGNLEVPTVSKPLADPFGNLDVPSLGVGNIEGKESVQFERKKERLIEVLEYKTITDKKNYLQSVRDRMVESNIDKYLLDSKANEFLSVDEVSYIQDNGQSSLDTDEKIQEKANEIWYSKIRNLEYVFLVKTAKECNLSITDAKKCLDLLVKDGQLVKSDIRFGKYYIKKDAKEKSEEVIDLDKIKNNFEELKKTNKKISDVDISGLEDINSIKDYLRGLVEGDQISPFDFIDVISSGYSQVSSKLEEIKKHLSESICQGKDIYQDLNKIRNIKGNINAMSVCQALGLKAELFSKYAQAIVDKINKERSSVLDNRKGVADSSASGAGASESAPVAGAVGGNTPENPVGTEDVIDLDKLVEDLEKRVLDDFKNGDLEHIQVNSDGFIEKYANGIDRVKLLPAMRSKNKLKKLDNPVLYWNSRKNKYCVCVGIGGEMLSSVYDKLSNTTNKKLPKITDVVHKIVTEINKIPARLDFSVTTDFVLECIKDKDRDFSLTLPFEYTGEIRDRLIQTGKFEMARFDSSDVVRGWCYKKDYLDSAKEKIVPEGRDSKNDLEKVKEETSYSEITGNDAYGEIATKLGLDVKANYPYLQYLINTVKDEKGKELDEKIKQVDKDLLDSFKNGNFQSLMTEFGSFSQLFLEKVLKESTLFKDEDVFSLSSDIFSRMKDTGRFVSYDNLVVLSYKYGVKEAKNATCFFGYSELIPTVIYKEIEKAKVNLPEPSEIVGYIKEDDIPDVFDISDVQEHIIDFVILQKVRDREDIGLFLDKNYIESLKQAFVTSGKMKVATYDVVDSGAVLIEKGKVYKTTYLDDILKRNPESENADQEQEQQPQENNPAPAVESDPLAKELDRTREKYAKLRAEYDYANAHHVRAYLELREAIKGSLRSATKKFENSQRFAPVDLPEKAKSSELMEAENAYKKALLEYRRKILEKQTKDGVLKKSKFEIRKGKLVEITDEDEAKTAGKYKKEKKENVEKVSINMALLDDAVLESEKLFALRMKNKPPIFGERIARLRSFLAKHKYTRILLTGTIIGMGTLVAGATPMMALGAGAVRVARGLGTIGVASGAGAITAKFLDSRRKTDSKSSFGEALKNKEEIDDDLMTTLDEISEKQMEKMKKDRRWATRVAFLAGGAFALGSTLYASEVSVKTGAENTNTVPRPIEAVKSVDTRPWYQFWGRPRTIQQQDNSSADSTLNQRPAPTGATGSVDQTPRGASGPTGTSGAGALNQQPPKVEAPVVNISEAPVKMEFSSLGSIDTMRQLKSSIDKIPEGGNFTNVRELLENNTPEQMTEKLGLWKPGEGQESALLMKGDRIFVDKEGQLAIERSGKVEILMDKSGNIIKYKGGFFHAQMPASVRLEPTRPFVEPKPRIGEEYATETDQFGEAQVVRRNYYYDDKDTKHYHNELVIEDQVPSDRLDSHYDAESDEINIYENNGPKIPNNPDSNLQQIKNQIDNMRQPTNIKPPSGFIDKPVDANGNGFIRYSGDNKVVSILDKEKNPISTIDNKGGIRLRDDLQFGSSSEQLASRLQYNTAISKLRAEGKISPIVTDIPYKPFKNSQFSVEEVVRDQEKTFDVLLNGKKITSFEGTDGKGKLVLEFNKELPRRNGWFIFSHKSDWYKAFEYFRDQAVSYTKEGVKIGNKTFGVASK